MTTFANRSAHQKEHSMPFITRFRIHAQAGVRAITAITIAVAVTSLNSGSLIAREPRPPIEQQDGDRGPSSDLTVEATLTAVCGAELISVIRSNESPFTTGSVTFVNVPGAAGNILIPANAVDCVQVTYSAQMRSGGFCFFRALASTPALSGVPAASVDLSPNGGGIRSGVSGDVTGDTHTLVWGQRLPVRPINAIWTISVQMRAHNGSAAPCTVDDYYVSIERKN
jgi:hypothetical protein